MTTVRKADQRFKRDDHALFAGFQYQLVTVAFPEWLAFRSPGSHSSCACTNTVPGLLRCTGSQALLQIGEQAQVGICTDGLNRVTLNRQGEALTPGILKD
ncbi:MAG: hypothetical protein ACKO3C_13245 [Betaproteobacteria bacterium]